MVCNLFSGYSPDFEVTVVPQQNLLSFLQKYMMFKKLAQTHFHITKSSMFCCKSMQNISISFIKIGSVMHISLYPIRDTLSHFIFLLKFPGQNSTNEKPAYLGPSDLNRKTNRVCRSNFFKCLCEKFIRTYMQNFNSFGQAVIQIQHLPFTQFLAFSLLIKNIYPAKLQVSKVKFWEDFTMLFDFMSVLPLYQDVFYMTT